MPLTHWDFVACFVHFDLILTRLQILDVDWLIPRHLRLTRSVVSIYLVDTEQIVNAWILHRPQIFFPLRSDIIVEEVEILAQHLVAPVQGFGVTDGLGNY